MDASKLADLRAAEPPVLIGLGAIGSWVARWLSANGIRYKGYDDDVVSLKNIAAGAFEYNDVGKHKAIALGGTSNIRARWDSEHAHFVADRSAVLVCADHGATRRLAAATAVNYDKPFYCAKANGNLWQVWSVQSHSENIEFAAFDRAAEENPVTVPCGDASVGRTASLGAAAELLSKWSGLIVTPDDVEASYGVQYDPAIVHAIESRWIASRAAAEEQAQEEARKSFDTTIDAMRTENDVQAVAELNRLRAERKLRKRVHRLTIHQRAIALLDRGETTTYAAKNTIGNHGCLAQLKRAEARLDAQNMSTNLALPDTIEITEVVA